MQIHILQHENHEHPGHISAWAASRGHALTVIDPRTSTLPAPEAVAFLIILGGAVNVDEEAAHPWLRPEKALVRQVVAAGAPILGICLGSQLLAETLGACVRPNPVPEIGWCALEADRTALAQAGLDALPLPEQVLEWHGQTFDIPPRALRLAGSRYCANQAFSQEGCRIGLQFHPEWTHDIVATVAKNEPYDANGTNMQALKAVMAGDFAATRPFLDALLDHLAQKAGARV